MLLAILLAIWTVAKRRYYMSPVLLLEPFMTRNITIRGLNPSYRGRMMSGQEADLFVFLPLLLMEPTKFRGI